MHRQVLLFALLVFGFASRVDAATIIFDECTQANLCGGVIYHNFAQPSGVITGSIISTISCPGGNCITFLQFGVNVASDVNPYFFHGPQHPGYTALEAGAIGPFGEFTDRWTSASLVPLILIGFSNPSGPFTYDLEPFFENPQGFLLAAEVRDNRTGTTSFIAARLNDVTPVPEPGTLVLFASGLVVAARRARKQRG